jgi:hypothetical protein
MPSSAEGAFIMSHARRAVTLAVASLFAIPALAQQQQVRPPIAQYGVDVGTRNMSIPGMPAGGMGGMGAMMMPGGMGGPQKELWLGLRSTQKATGTPEAQHEIPPGMNMGRALPLLPPPPAQPGSRLPDEEGTPEKPKARLLVYWGCGDTIRPGQPKVADTEKMTPQQFAQALAGRSPPDRASAIRNAQLRWPNEREPRQVPANASLRGDQLVQGNATPDIRFAIGDKQDFMAPVEVTARGAMAGPHAIEWRTVPTAQGYFLQAMGHREKSGETIIWTSSEVQDTGWGLMSYLPNDFLRRMIAEKVVLPPDATRCAIPQGVFEGVEGAMLQVIGYGEELNLVHPPRPADPKVPWEQIWTVKVRVKSVGMMPLGMGDDEGGAPRSRSRAAPPRTPAEPQAQPQPPAKAEKAPNPLEDAADAVNKLKGLLKF